MNIKNELLNTFKDAEAIYLFGSFANGSFNDESDIDIAVLYKNKINPIKLFEIQQQLFLKFDRLIDLIDLQNINDVFAYEIINTAKKLKTSKFAEDYEYRVWLRYLDLQEDRKEIIKDFING